MRQDLREPVSMTFMEYMERKLKSDPEIRRGYEEELQREREAAMASHPSHKQKPVKRQQRKKR